MRILDPNWEDKVSKEAMNFVQAVQHNFHHGLTTATGYAPDKSKPEYRARVLDYFFDAIVGVTVQCVAKYGNASESLEEMVKEKMGEKFQYIRDQLAKNPPPGMNVPKES